MSIQVCLLTRGPWTEASDHPQLFFSRPRERFDCAVRYVRTSIYNRVADNFHHKFIYL